MQSQKLLIPLYAAVFLLVCSQAYLFMKLQNFMQSNLNPAGSLATAPGPIASSSNVTVGNMPVAYQGTIMQIQNGSLQLKTSDKTVTFTLNSNTVYDSLGTQKNNVEYSQELAAYNAKVNELLKDQQKNAAELKSMNIPSPFNKSSLTLSDLKVGDAVSVTPGALNSNGSYDAAEVLLQPAPAVAR